jgi:hypothetical protein
MKAMVILKLTKTTSRRLFLARPIGHVRDGLPQNVDYGWAWRGPETPSKFCPISDTFRPTVGCVPDVTPYVTRMYGLYACVACDH